MTTPDTWEKAIAGKDMHYIICAAYEKFRMGDGELLPHNRWTANQMIEFLEFAFNSRLKAQRIKDIEEIEGMLPPDHPKEEDSKLRGSTSHGYNLAISIVKELLTSRKAAIKEI